MKILTAQEMREVDRLTIEAGIPGQILMESAGASVVSYLDETFHPLSRERVLVLCGKGNNGGDGFVVARRLFERHLTGELTVVETVPAAELRGDTAQARKMLEVSGCSVHSAIPDHAWSATLLVDALLGTGLKGPASHSVLALIRLVNTRFAHAVKVAVDIPSGFPTDETVAEGEYVHVDHTVTFTALKRSQAFSPSYEAMGKLRVYPIGSPDALCEANPRYPLRLTTPADLTHLLRPRPKDSNKGMYGHVLVIGGSVGKSGAPAMSGLAALRSGAGLVTVASAHDAIPLIAVTAPELMTEPLAQTASGHIARAAQPAIEKLAANKTLVAIGPGIGTDEETVELVRWLFNHLDLPMVFDADALNALAGTGFTTSRIRILTPHPGEMGRLLGTSTRQVQQSRLPCAQEFARQSGASVVLKGDRTLIAFPDGETWVNPTGSPSLATAGTGDILTGITAGLVAQHTGDWKRAVAAAVWLHGCAGEMGGSSLGEQSFIATDILRFLPEAMDQLRAPVRYP